MCLLRILSFSDEDFGGASFPWVNKRGDVMLRVRLESDRYGETEDVVEWFSVVMPSRYNGCISEATHCVFLGTQKTSEELRFFLACELTRNAMILPVAKGSIPFWSVLTMASVWSTSIARVQRFRFASSVARRSIRICIERICHSPFVLSVVEP